MLLITKHTGQLCNQIWSLVPLITYAEHANSKICILNMRRDIVNLFPTLRRYKRIWWIHLCGEKIGRLWRIITFLLEKYIQPFMGALEDDIDNGIRIIDGWEHHHDKSFVKDYRQMLCTLFTPEREVNEKVKSTLSSYDGITVGVHIRRGDYKDWCGGAYDYSNEEYIRIMQSLADEAKQKQKAIRFLICSNEPIDIQQNELNILQIPHTDGITDLYGLASCDYIIGPPSTYSQWASFYGNVPLCILLQPQQKIIFNDFSQIVALDMFANGNQLKMDEKTQRFYITKQ